MSDSLLVNTSMAQAFNPNVTAYIDQTLADHQFDDGTVIKSFSTAQTMSPVSGLLVTYEASPRPGRARPGKRPDNGIKDAAATQHSSIRAAAPLPKDTTAEIAVAADLAEQYNQAASPRAEIITGKYGNGSARHVAYQDKAAVKDTLHSDYDSTVVKSTVEQISTTATVDLLVSYKQALAGKCFANETGGNAAAEEVEVSKGTTRQTGYDMSATTNVLHNVREVETGKHSLGPRDFPAAAQDANVSAIQAPKPISETEATSFPRKDLEAHTNNLDCYTLDELEGSHCNRDREIAASEPAIDYDDTEKDFYYTSVTTAVLDSGKGATPHRNFKRQKGVNPVLVGAALLLARDGGEKIVRRRSFRGQIVRRQDEVTEKLKSSGGDIGALKKGAFFWKVKPNVKFYRRRFWLDPNEPVLRYDPSHKNPCLDASDPSIDVTTIIDVLPGWKTDTFNRVVSARKDNAGLVEDRCFSIVYGQTGYEAQTLDLFGDDVESVQEWIKGLQSLVVIMKSIQQEREYEDWLLAQYKKADKDSSNSLDFQECLKLLKLLNIKLEEDHAKRLFDEANTNKRLGNGKQVLDGQEFLTFYKLLLRRPELEGLFSTYAKTSLCSLTAGELCSFLQREQKVKSCSISQAEKYIELYETTNAKEQQRMTVSGFTNLMTAEDFDIFDLKENTVWMDMTRPLNHYYIYSSHNTYLMGNQLTGESSVQAYINAFLQGCRCVELDLWDGSGDEPVITHGNTMTSDIRVRDVLLDAVLPYAFKTSPYPVILSVENHLNPVQQDKFALMLKEILKDKLYDTLQDQDMSQLPSPEQLKYKVIIKAKRGNTSPRASGANFNGVTDSESESEMFSMNGADLSPNGTQKLKKKKTKKTLVSEQLSLLVNICQAVHFEGLAEAVSNGKCYQMSSLSEVKAKNTIESDPTMFIRYAQKQLVRIYPKGIRVQSSNLGPLPFWNVGSQIVALNLQSADLSTRQNTAKFRLNGASGYVLKPDYLLDVNLQTEPKEKRLLIRVISGQSLPYVSGNKNDIVDPYVSILVNGHPEDEVKQKTRHISNNGFNPVWNEDFSFSLKRPELDLVTFEVKDHDKRGTNDLIGYYSIWATAISPGYRHVPLVDKSGKTILAASVFVHVVYE